MLVSLERVSGFLLGVAGQFRYDMLHSHEIYQVASERANARRGAENSITIRPRGRNNTSTECNALALLLLHYPSDSVLLLCDGNRIHGQSRRILSKASVDAIQDPCNGQSQRASVY